MRFALPPVLRAAAALALGSAVSLGLARFAYALLLAPMRADLGWSYLVAGAMNTVNAVGYLAGALLSARLLQGLPTQALFIGSTAATGVFLALHGWVESDAALFAMRFASGLVSASALISGALLAARLVGESQAPPGTRAGGPSAGLILGIYYGGTGVGIVASAVLVPPLVERPVPHAWQAAWIGIGAIAMLATAVIAVVLRRTASPSRSPGSAPASPSAPASASAAARRSRAFDPAILSYVLFGLGYIGYMTFVLALLREQGLGATGIVAFYSLLGTAVIASSWLWARLLQRSRGGGAMSLLNALLAVATLLPVLSSHPLAVFASGLLFGAVFLSVVASTTSLLRHNLPASEWGRWIGSFTVAFAVGQIVGPSLVGWIADIAGGLGAGLACSAAVLALAALAAWRQKPLAAATP
jgi:predicted MFS family arabinose efflux permease